MKNKAYLLLGSNKGDSEAILDSASLLIAKEIGSVVRASHLYKTKAWGKSDQNDFLNQVLEIETSLPDNEVLTKCLDIEQQLGRIRKEKWGERTIDIDILLYNNEIIETEQLNIPHPFLHLRRFTLVPLSELVPNLIHPKLKKTISELLNTCEDSLEVIKIP